MKKLWEKIKVYVIAIGIGVLGFLGFYKKRKADNQISDNEEIIDKGKEVIDKVTKTEKEISGVVKDNEEIIDKYSDLRNSD